MLTSSPLLGLIHFLQDTLDSKMKDRPKPEELIKGGILNSESGCSSPLVARSPRTLVGCPARVAVPCR